MTNRGFTLIEIAVVLVLVGLVTTAGLIIMPKLWHEKQRVETQKYLLAAKAALLTYATNYNALPIPDNTDRLPATTLKLKHADSFDRPLRYIANSKLLLDLASADKTLPCSTLQDYFDPSVPLDTEFPHLWQYGLPKETGVWLPVAAVLISPGADGVMGQYFTEDGVTLIGDNSTTDLAVNFVQAPASETFDDLVVYLTIPELMNALPECRQ